MKKILVIASLVGVAVSALGIGGLAFAQSETPPPFTNPGYGHGMMGGWGGNGGMRGSWSSEEHGPYHAFMLETFADGLGLSVDQIEARLESGESMWQIAESEGVSGEEFADLMQQARAAMLEQAVEDGTLTQEQVDTMGGRWQMGGFGPGYGGCSGYSAQGGFHRGPHGRWQTP
jgi:hypothetical protein